MRSILKSQFLSFFNKALNHTSSRSSLSKIINEHNVETPRLQWASNPYYMHDSEDAPNYSYVVFVTSRFRSGSSALWNMFRHEPSCTAYYEPFNERQWFNKTKRGSKVDATHLGIQDYWCEYEELEHLSEFYDERWIDTNLMMDAKSWNPNMRKYIDELINCSQGIPVLQFNRIDFRLEWLKSNYPNSKIIHLYRDPRDQWCSFLTDKKLMNAENITQTYQDAFYLDSWCNDLKKFYPFLSTTETPHPYRRFYYLWCLSYMFGKKFSDYSISYEDLVSKRNEIDVLFTALNWQGYRKDLAQFFVKSKQQKWKLYANENWFKDLEVKSDIVLKRHLNLNQIKEL